MRHAGARLSIDVSATTTVEDYGRDRFVELLDRLRPEVVLANAGEATVIDLAGRTPPPGGIVVVKDGPRPALVVRDDGTTVEIDAEVVDRVSDTTGAGDAFAAGFLAALMLGADAVAACRAGHVSAARLLHAGR